MSSWSDGFLRGAQFWLLYLGIGLPLLGALAGGFCVLLKDRAGAELGRRELAGRVQIEQRAAEVRRRADGDLRAQLDQAAQRVRALERQANTRVITPEHRAMFIEALEFSPRGKVSVNVTAGVDSEAVAYAEQIREMIAAAGYDTGAVVHVEATKQIPAGVFMVVHDAKHPFAGALQQALGKIGLNATGLVDESVPGEEVRVEVGVKP
jgi:hypothetical protein